MKHHGSVGSTLMGGWITLEILLALILLSVVLHLVQRQSANQWQTIHQGQQAANLEQNQNKQALMVQLTGSGSWLSSEYSTQHGSYPECQPCTGAELRVWFRAAQYEVSPKVQSMVRQDE
ncbi:hypothetical protein [Marinomonas pollencensis]|uniref:Uncharacterized protein n=1 Tax=Marinomonas pollencensis TaxID=491954 RepID=A0A3E0DNG2_9GAMM|nr:hypothetical protein [Marinomonas pollencensis]REG84289.1 hypothetical protein DFP81_104168 [Marinomonas pollencensis]